MGAHQRTTHPIDDDEPMYGLLAGASHADDPPASVSYPALEEGLYVAGTDAEQRTELLTQQLLQWAQLDNGFCYIQPDIDQTLDLLAKLPDRRLEDVIWIDLDRPKLQSRDQLADVPEGQRVTITPLTPDETPSTDCLATPTWRARVIDFLDVCEQDPAVDWAVLSLLESILECAVSQELTLREVTSRVARITNDRHDSGADRRYVAEAEFDRRVAEQVARVETEDPTVLGRVAECLHAFTVTPHNRVFRDETSISFRDAITRDAILLVSGSRPHDDPPWGSGAHAITRATQLLATTVLRRCWEVLQYRPTGMGTMFPIAVDHVEEVLPRDPTVLREALSTQVDGGGRKRPAIWLSGPAPVHLAEPLRGIVRREIAAWELLTTAPDLELEQLWRRLRPTDGENKVAPLSRLDHRAVLATAGTGLLGFDPYAPYPLHHDDTAVAETIVRSSTEDGREVPLFVPGDVSIN